MTINEELIVRKITLIRADLAELDKFRAFSLQEYTARFDIQLQVERLLERIIGRLVDINYHILKDRNITPKDYRESFFLVARQQLAEAKLVNELANRVGLRNILTHEYDAINPKLVHQAIAGTLDQVPQYLKQIMAHISG